VRSHQPDAQIAALIRQIFRDCLGEDLGPDQDLFESGGSSLHAMCIIGRLEREIGIAYPVPVFYDSPKASSVIAFVRSVQRGDSPGKPSMRT
jgi:acyl carrier protein